LETFTRLFSRGDLFSVSRRSVKDCLGTDGIEDLTRLAVSVPTVQQTEMAVVADEPSLAFGMTEQGSTRWEAFAEPDWNRYIRHHVSNVDEELDMCQSDLWSRTRDRLEDAIRFWYAGEPIASTEEWEAVLPWRVTYWKTLQLGYHVKLLTRTIKSSFDLPGEEAKRWGETLKWHRFYKEIKGGAGPA
jgi:hypothetical protein